MALKSSAESFWPGAAGQKFVCRLSNNLTNKLFSANKTQTRQTNFATPAEGHTNNELAKTKLGRRTFERRLRQTSKRIRQTSLVLQNVVSTLYSRMYRSDTIYHLYNHSNGYQPVFRSEENYFFFLRKVREHLFPVAEILCYCLMPDHFHFMIMPKSKGCQPSISLKPNNGRSENPEEIFQQELSHQLRILLSSYTKAYNRRYNLRGSLFRAKTKAKPAYDDFLPEDFLMSDDIPFTQFVPYLKVCFKYIHHNPVKAGLANRPTEWAFSSALDYANLRGGTLCNYELTERLIGIKRQNIIL